MRKAILPALLLSLAAGEALAFNMTFYGTPGILPNGDLLLNNQTLQLWGVERIVPGQQCQSGDVSWNCGAQATAALMEIIGSNPVTCRPMPGGSGGAMAARCFKGAVGDGNDLAKLLVEKGWARDKADVSGGQYAAAQKEAEQRKIGIWSVFSTKADDRKDGAPSASAESAPPAAADQNPQVIYSVIPSGQVIVLPTRHRDYRRNDRDGDHGGKSGEQSAKKTVTKEPDAPMTPLSFGPAQQLNSRMPGGSSEVDKDGR